MELRVYRVEWRDQHGAKQEPMEVKAKDSDEMRQVFHAKAGRGAYFESASEVRLDA